MLVEKRLGVRRFIAAFDTSIRIEGGSAAMESGDESPHSKVL